MSRRGALKAGLALSAVSGGGAAFSLTLGGPAPGAQRLTSSELRVVSAVAEAMFPRGAMPVDGVEAGVALEVDGIVADIMDELRASAFRYVLRALEYGTLASRGACFSALPVETRREVLQQWANPGLLVRRVALDSLRVVLGMAYYGHPAVQVAMGWRATCTVDEVDV